MKCFHFDECGNESVYGLDTVEGETIRVCVSCDEKYTACEICGKQGIWDDGYGNMSKYKDTDDWPTCFLCQEKLKEVTGSLMLDDIVNDRFTIHNIEFHRAGDLKGYVTGMIKFPNHDKVHEFLYRVYDPLNGDANTLVSIDYGYLNSQVDELWDTIQTDISTVCSEIRLEESE